MGASWAKLTGLWTTLLPAGEIRVIMVGLVGAGKSTLLQKLRLGEIVETTSSAGFSLESVTHIHRRQVTFLAFDLGDRQELRPIWQDHYANANAVIFIVDSNDRRRERLETARATLHEMLDDIAPQHPLLVLANKQDLPNAMTSAEVTEELGLPSLQTREWHIEGTCAANGDGLYEGVDWLSTALRQQK